ncbi:MAG: hypothetical protein HYV09_08885 [Deltaproteobacteria bacterium]|nr:hypothetical protein [Deltaproteobacteria bacterium]
MFVRVALLLPLLHSGCRGAEVDEAVGDSAFDEGAIEADVDAADAPSVEVSADTRSDADSGVPGCGATSLFCSGFEVAPTAEWGAVRETGGGAVRLDTIAHSGLFGLHTSIPIGAVLGVSAMVTKDFALVPSTRTSAASVWIRLEGQTTDADLQLVRLASDAAGHGVTVLIGPAGLMVETSGASAKRLPITTSPPNKTFFKLVLEAPLVNAAARVRVMFNTSVVFDDASGSTAVAGTITPSLQLGAAAMTSSPTKAAFVVRYDDVTIEPR